jgi:hypothetical protein
VMEEGGGIAGFEGLWAIAIPGNLMTLARATNVKLRRSRLIIAVVVYVLPDRTPTSAAF